MLTEDNIMELSKTFYHKNIYSLYFAIECVGIKMDFLQTPLVSIVAATAWGPGGVLCDVQLNFYQSGNVIGSVKSIVHIFSYNCPKILAFKCCVYFIAGLLYTLLPGFPKRKPIPWFQAWLWWWMGPFGCAVALFCSPGAFVLPLWIPVIHYILNYLFQKQWRSFALPL